MLKSKKKEIQMRYMSYATVMIVAFVFGSLLVFTNIGGQELQEIKVKIGWIEIGALYVPKSVR